MVNDDKNTHELSEEFHDDDMFLQDADDDFSSEVPEVADKSGNGGSPIMLIGIAIVAIIIAVVLFSGDDEVPPGEEAKKDEKTDEPVAKVKPNRGGRVAALVPPSGGVSGVGARSTGSARKLVPPPPPPPPPPPTSNQSSDGGTFASDFGLGARQGKSSGANIMDERVQSNIMLLGGSVGSSQGPAEDRGADAFAEVEESTAPRSEAKIAGNPEQMIFQGKVIDVVLESAISTDLPGMIRGVVSRDVYAEAGKTILIPKGSRLVGTYNSAIIPGQFRVYMLWNRVILPNGVDLVLDSGSIDLLGRSGSQGAVDSKLFEIYSNAILQSAVTVSFAAAAAALTNAEEVEEGTTSGGDSTETGDVVDLAVVSAVDDFGSTISGSLDTFLNLQPTITIDQGVEVKVMVSRDLFFSKALLTGSRIIR